MISKFMMSNFCFPVRTQNMSTQKMSNVGVFSTEDSESRMINADESKQKKVKVRVCSTDKNESIFFQELGISVTNSKVEYTKDEEPLVADTLLNRAQGDFKLFK